MVLANFPKDKYEEENRIYTSSIILMFRDSDSGDHKFLCNFFRPCAVTLPAEEAQLSDGSTVSLPEMEFISSEHAYMAWKTLDLETRKKMAAMESCGDVKKFTYEEDFPLRDDYSDEGRLEAMRIILESKFSRINPELRKKLIDTGNATLLEGNSWNDTFFGFDINKGEGKNYLGQILMYVRDLVRIEEGLAPVKEEVFDTVLNRAKAFNSTFK